MSDSSLWAENFCHGHLSGGIEKCSRLDCIAMETMTMFGGNSVCDLDVNELLTLASMVSAPPAWSSARMSTLWLRVPATLEAASVELSPSRILVIHEGTSHVSGHCAISTGNP